MVSVRRYQTVFVTVVPSPYQRDLFRALAAREEIGLTVCYLEAASPDSPWPGAQLEAYERILPGFWVPFLGTRWHVNWSLPELSRYDFVILNNFSTVTAQWLMRCPLRGKRWVFWGERLREQTIAWKEFAQRKLIEPLERAAGIVGIGSDAESDYRRRFPNTSHFCIPYYCDLSGFLARPMRPIPSSEIHFLFCGQMNRRKGVDLLLMAFDRLVNKRVNAYLVLVGREAELPQFLRMISPAAGARIDYAGFQPPERLPEYFSQADVLVLPSRYDGWGVVVNQALGAGLPVICSDAVGAGHDLVEEEINGLKFQRGNVDSLAEGMGRLAANPEITAKWGETSRRKARHLSPEVGASNWIEVFSTLLNKPSA